MHSTLFTNEKWHGTLLQQLEAESQNFKHEKQMSQEQLVELLQRFSLEVKWIEELKTEVGQHEMMATTPEVNPMHISPKVLEGATAMETTIDTPGKENIFRPPSFVYFSGIKPIPKDEGSHNQWVSQVRDEMDTHVENSVRAATVNSLRGPARELVSFIGYSANINLILSEVSNRFDAKREINSLGTFSIYHVEDKG